MILSAFFHFIFLLDVFIRPAMRVVDENIHRLIITHKSLSDIKLDLSVITSNDERMGKDSVGDIVSIDNYL
jgi:hypothetical protein